MLTHLGIQDAVRSFSTYLELNMKSGKSSTLLKMLTKTNASSAIRRDSQKRLELQPSNATTSLVFLGSVVATATKTQTKMLFP